VRIALRNVMNADSDPEADTGRPIIFVGPSLPVEVARRTLPDADYRPPVRRGDLTSIPTGAVVGIVDGVFAQDLAISPGEIRDAIARGVRIYGAASMGALRAAEVPGVIGVGRIAEMYRSGAIERDDEVALIFDSVGYRPLTEPLVNLRYGVERLTRSGTLNRDSGEALIAAAAGLHFSDRTYEAILAVSQLDRKEDAADLVTLLRGYNLKREDAQSLIEAVAHAAPALRSSAEETEPMSWSEAIGPERLVRTSEASDAPVLIWESGDRLAFEEILDFLKLTGRFEPAARKTVARFALAGAPLRAARPGDEAQPEAAQWLLDATRLIWGWESPEEAHVTFRDLGLGLADLALTLDAESEAARRLQVFAAQPTRSFAKALRSELWLDDLALKRDALRAGALRHFAALGLRGGAPDPTEIEDARRTISRLRGTMQWSVTRAELARLGLDGEKLAVAVRDLALARRAATDVVMALGSSPPNESRAVRAESWRALGLDVAASPKVDTSNRFSRAPAEAEACAEEIAQRIGIVRIGLIGELDTLGIHVAQAFGDRKGWSASFASGKSDTREGARLGAIMEEVEIQAQDAFRPPIDWRGTHEAAGATLPRVDPMDLGLPFDSPYSEDRALDWTACIDLVEGARVLVPTAALVSERQPDDILHSPRLGGKIFSSSGLGSGFSLAEASVHAAAEVIERHAVRLAETEIDNPGGVGMRSFWFVDPESLPPAPRTLAEKFTAAGMVVRILDITSEIAAPTFFARVFDDPFEAYASMTADGSACHPDPEVAITMALLEAGQTKAGVIAGGREDYSLQARSLGRHERPRTMTPASQVFWFCNDPPMRAFPEAAGLRARDIRDELEWLVEQVRAAGLPRMLLADCTVERIAPAHAVRVVIPGVETTNPLHTGLRARATLIRDLLPRPPLARG